MPDTLGQRPTHECFSGEFRVVVGEHCRGIPLRDQSKRAVYRPEMSDSPPMSMRPPPLASGS